MAELMTASNQWANRPNDQRFLSLDELRQAVAQRKQESWTATPKLSQLRAVIDEQQHLGLQVYDPTAGSDRILVPTNWGFNQLSQHAKAPASYLRTLPTELAAINLQWGLEHAGLREDTLVLAQSNGKNELRAMTSTSYGRIWDLQVVDAVMRVNSDGRWQIPSASYATMNPRRATTLYASDRDVFIFLVDPNNPIEVGNEKLFRGFMTWNSEVGAGVFGLTTFLYRYICDNRIIWGATDVKELRIRHTGGAPERFAYEGSRYLRQYADEATAKTVQQIKAAQTLEIPEAKEENGMQNWLRKRGFSATIAKASVDAAVAEEGQARTLWDIVNGITAHARTIPHTDARVELETQAGKLMQLVS